MSFKLRTKILTGFIVVAIIGSVIGIIGIVNMRKIDNADTELYEKMTVPITNLLRITEYFQRVRVNVRDMLLSDNIEQIIEHINTINKYSEIIVNNANEYEKSIQTKEGRAIYDKFIEARKIYRSDLDKIIVLVKAGNIKNAEIYVNTIAFKSAMEEQKAIENLVEYKIEMAKNIAGNNSKLANTSTVIMIAITVIGFIISIILAIWLGIYIISRPLIKISDTLINGASQISLASNQLSSSSQEIANGATEQASSIEETTSSMEELASMVKQNASNAKEASVMSQKATEASQTGHSQMEEMLGSMTEINKSSSEISKVIKVIDDIAFQTNILALNAAVEAARAGEAGMGFAVVADEVKNLANKAAEAAKETSGMIETSIKRTENGLGTAKKLAEIFKEILSHAQKVTEVSKEVEMASIQQDTGINQVNKAIVQFDEVVQANASSAEETASSAEELLAQVDTLNNIVTELVKLVNGKAEEIQKKEINYIEQKNKSVDIKKQTIQNHIKHNTSTINQKQNIKMTTQKKKKISPEQTIPFEEDEDFTQF